MPYEAQQGPFLISTDPTKIDVVFVHRFLSETSYWAQNIPFDVVKTSIENSLCFGVYDGAHPIGFARVITDKATFGYLADVFILESYRGQGLSKWLMEIILEHPELQGFRRWVLATADAHGLYEQYGFTPLAKPDRWMEKHNPQVYS
jgi:GNAT superfamily N-acetyltransferase